MSDTIVKPPTAEEYLLKTGMCPFGNSMILCPAIENGKDACVKCTRAFDHKSKAFHSTK